MSGPDFFAVVSAQRACRRFGPDAVPDGDIARMIEAAIHAPSAENAQPWVFVVVRDRRRREAIGDLTRRLWRTGGSDQARGRLDTRLFGEVDEAVREGFGGAPLLIVVAGDGRDRTRRSVLASSVYPAVQNLLLAARALGYGSALTTLSTLAAGELRAIVELPDGIEPMAVVPIGRPAHSLGPPRRTPAADKTHLDRYGAPFPGGSGIIE